MNENEIAWAKEIIRISGIVKSTAHLLNPHAKNRVYYAALYIASLVKEDR